MILYKILQVKHMRDIFEKIHLYQSLYQCLNAQKKRFQKMSSEFVSEFASAGTAVNKCNRLLVRSS